MTFLIAGSGSRPQAAPASLPRFGELPSSPSPLHSPQWRRLFLVLGLSSSSISPPLLLPPLPPPSPFSPESPARPCIQGLQLADEFIRPKALPRSMTAFRPTRRTSGGPWWSLGTHHGHWRRDKKVPQCPLNVCVFSLGAHFLERHFVH